jgi:hypothetical protein
VLVVYPVMSFDWTVAVAGAGALSAATAGTVAIEAPVIAIVPAMASALSFLVKVMSHAPLHVMFVP